MSRFRWYRKWRGGKWSLWMINLNLTTNPLWIRGWDPPGCALYCYEREDWGTS